eukprot:SAG11_NODE_8981_length_957_cov_3.228705_2_plen_205_part_00
MDRADKAERELSEAQQEISDRTLHQEYTFEKPIPLSKIFSVFEAEFPVTCSKRYWKTATTANKVNILMNKLEESIRDKLIHDTVYASEFPLDLRQCMNVLFNNYAEEFEVYEECLWTPWFMIKHDGRSAVSIKVSFLDEDYFEDEPPALGFVPKGCFRIIEKYLTHTLEEIANEPLEKVLAEIHELQTELGLTEYAFRDSSEED